MSSNIKEIKLKPEIAFHNNLIVSVLDFPQGDGPSGKERQRCKITVEYAEADVAPLKAQGKDFDGAMKYYQEWLYQVVKVNLAMDWKCISGYEEVMEIIGQHVKAYY